MLPHKPSELFRVLVELPGHQVLATGKATEKLGAEGVEKVVAEIGSLLVRIRAFNDRWVSVAFWDHNGQRLQAITRYWLNDGEQYRTELSFFDENYGGFVRGLAEVILERMTPEQWELAANGEIRPLSEMYEANVIISDGYEVVCIQARVILEHEQGNGKPLSPPA